MHQTQGDRLPSISSSTPESSVRTESRRLLALAAPVVLGQLGLMGMGVVDVLVVGRWLGRDPLAALSIAHTWSFGVTVIAIGVAMGLDPMLTQGVGANRSDRVGAAVRDGGVLLALLCVPTMAVHAAGGWGLALLGQPPELVPMAASYCEVVAASVPAMLLFSGARQLLQAYGRMAPATVAIVIGNVVNLAADIYFVEQGWGVQGVAWATTLVRCVMAIVLLGWAWPAAREVWTGFANWSFANVVALGSVAIPVGLQTALEVWSFSVVTLLAGWLGAQALASHTIVLNLASVAFMVPLGLSAAAATRVGNLVGAEMPWHRAAAVAIGWAVLFMSVSASAFLVAPGFFIGLYGPDPDVAAVAVGLLWWAACFALFDGVQVVSFGVLRGLGDTRLPALVPLVGFWCFGIPLGAVLAFQVDLGLPGLWMGLAGGLAAMAMTLVLRIRYLSMA